LFGKISGQYEGECKKGLAHGKGKAVGVDTYEGDFKKGLPHGHGKYIWANGDFFEGEWKKGKKDGKGKIVYAANDSLVQGFWKNDEYIGLHKEPYQVISKSNIIERVILLKKSDSPNEAEFTFKKQNNDVNVQNVIVTREDGRIFQTKNVQANSYPFQITLRFQNTQNQEGHLEIEIYQKGKWEIVVMLLE